jgi:hypothetical protein
MCPAFLRALIAWLAASHLEEFALGALFADAKEALSKQEAPIPSH